MIASPMLLFDFSHGVTHDAGEYEDHCKYYEPWLLAIICGTIIVPYNTILVYVSSCSCLHGKSFFRFSLIGRSCKNLFEYVGGKMMIVVICKFFIITQSSFSERFFFAFIQV